MRQILCVASIVCASANAFADRRCVTVSNDQGDSLLYVFDDRGQVQSIGAYRFTWKGGHIVRVEDADAKAADPTSWTYKYGAHGEFLEATEHGPGTAKVLVEWTWSGTFGAKRSNAPKLYGGRLSTFYRPIAGPIDAQRPDASFTGDAVWPGQVTVHYDHGVNTSDDGFHGSKTTFTYDSNQHLVKSLDTSFTGVQEPRNYKYDGDRLVHEDSKLGRDAMRSIEYRYDSLGRVASSVQSSGNRVDFTYTYNYECPTSTK